MKKTILILMIFFWTNFVQRQPVIFPGYTSYWNAKTLIPDSVIWTITKAHLQMPKVPRKNQFHSSNGRQNQNRDYLHSHYQRGHNSSYEDNAYSIDAEFQCFDFLNMFPQDSLLNEQTWFHLENYSRQKALQYNSCKVKTSWAIIDKKIGVDSVVVPLYCIKELWFADQYEKYIMPNKDTVIKHDFTYYKVN